MSAPSTTKPTEYAHVVCTPGMLGGEPRIDGHRIRVRDVVAARDIDGLSPDDIIHRAFPSLTLAEVYAALAYFEDHRDEIDAFSRAEADFIERFRRENPHTVHDLRPKDGA
jgi:uncharacterized protein (DUF433 family)